MIEKIILKNGLRILLEYIPYIRSASMGIWIETGSRHEKNNLSGISHFTEHMLFKGTHKRSARDIADQMDMIGGQVNAFTSKEQTCIHAKVLDVHVCDAFEILSDMYHNSKFEQSDIDLERGVIYEEIDMYEDTPEELVVDRLYDEVWKGSDLQKSILGTRGKLKNINHDQFIKYVAKRYTPSNTIVSIAGNFDKELFLKNCEALFGDDDNKLALVKESLPVYTPMFSYKRKPIEQNHICLGFEGVAAGHDDSYTCAVLANILGGGISSRLFQKIREEKGLCYSIFAFSTSYKDAGILGIYAALAPKAQCEVVDLILHETQDIVKNGVNKVEFVRGREQIKASLIISFESTSSRMGALARGEMTYGRIVSMDDLLERLDAVTIESVNALAARIFDQKKLALSVVGRQDDALSDLYYSIVK